MENVETVSTSIWCVWAIIGLVAGIMLGRSSARGGVYTLLCCLVAIIFAVVGGWVFCSLFGAGEKMQYLSLIISVLSCAFGLWIFRFCARPRS